MANESRHDTGATPPGGGRSGHETMRQAAQRPVKGPSSTNTLAAGGGLELPGHRATDEREPAPAAEERIPGERDASTATTRQPGSIGGRFWGGDTPSADPSSLMDEATRHDRELEGGGGD